MIGERTAIKNQLANDSAQIERNQSLLTQELSENATRKGVVVTAPGTLPAGPSNSTTKAGDAYKVTALNVRAGQAVQAGQTIATLVPLSQTTDGKPVMNVEAHLFAPSRTAGFLQAGQAVYLRYAAYPYQKFGLQQGRITAISDTPFAANELPPNLANQLMAQNQSSEALFRITVQLQDQTIRTYGNTIALKPGLTLEADVLQERRKVWEWVLEPLLAARANMKVLSDDLKPVESRSKLE